MSEKLVQSDCSAATASAPGRQKNLSKSYLLVVFVLGLTVPSIAQRTVTIETGLPINFSTLTLHVQGQPINVFEITVSLYPMNTPPPWPSGLWLYSWVQADASEGVSKSSWGQGQWCHWWFNQVATLEAQNLQQVPFPYLQVNLPTGTALIETDEQIPVYPAGAVTCWQANNDYAAP